MLRYGAYFPDVIDRLHWMSSVLGPLLQAAVRRHGPVDVTAILAQMVQMGDEAHNRNRAGTLMFAARPAAVDDRRPGPDRRVSRAAAFIGGNDHFFLNLAMPACKLALDAAAASRARRWWWRWPGTAPTSASRSRERAMPGSRPRR